MTSTKLTDLTQTKKKAKAPKFQNFIEAFKDSQGGGSRPSDRVNNDFDFEAFLTESNCKGLMINRLKKATP